MPLYDPDIHSVKVRTEAPDSHRKPVVKRLVTVGIIATSLGVGIGLTSCGNPCNTRGDIPGECWT